MVRGLATVKDSLADEEAWEESLNALAEELWFWAVGREGLAARGVGVSAREIARARVLARDVQIVAGLHGSVDTDRAAALLEAAHQLLTGSSGVRFAHSVVDVEDLDDEVTLPNRPNPFRLRDLFDEDRDATEATMPGVPIAVFRKYLAAVRH